jgi:hypothetical protein
MAHRATARRAKQNRLLEVLLQSGAAVGQVFTIEHAFPAASGSQRPTGADIAPSDTPGTNTIEITKIEEQDLAGNWHDVTSAFTRTDNPSALVKVKLKVPGESGLALRKLRFHYKTKESISKDPVLTVTFS